MSAAIRIFQGEDKTIIIRTNEDISAATEVEFVIDTPTQIKKTLSDGEITNVTGTSFTVQIDAADTETVEHGEYLFQCRATVATKIRQGVFSPNKIEIQDSAFTTQGSGNDYN